MTTLLPDGSQPPVTLAEMAEWALADTRPRWEKVRVHSIDALQRLLGAPPDRPAEPYTPWTLFGIPVFVAPQIPPDIVVLVAHDGTMQLLKIEGNPDA